MERFFNEGRWAVWAIWGICALIAFCIWFSYNFDFVDICDRSDRENVAVCARQWIGAASGYVAALFAGITIFFLYRQNAEQKKQTDFLLGDADPTLDVSLDLDDHEQIVVRLVNWNRRGIVLTGVDLMGVDAAIWLIMESKLNDEKAKVAEQPFLRGWEDRSLRPHVLQYKISATLRGKLIQEWPKTTAIAVNVHIISERPRRMPLKAFLYPHDH